MTTSKSHVLWVCQAYWADLEQEKFNVKNLYEWSHETREKYFDSKVILSQLDASSEIIISQNHHSFRILRKLHKEKGNEVTESDEELRFSAFRFFKFWFATALSWLMTSGGGGSGPALLAYTDSLLHNSQLSF